MTQLPETTIGRLRKRIAKLKQQRGHWQAKYDDLRGFFEIYPYINTHRERYETEKANRERLRELEATQAILVRELERYKKRELLEDGDG